MRLIRPKKNADDAYCHRMHISIVLQLVWLAIIIVIAVLESKFQFLTTEALQLIVTFYLIFTLGDMFLRDR